MKFGGVTERISKKKSADKKDTARAIRADRSPQAMK